MRTTAKTALRYKYRLNRRKLVRTMFVSLLIMSIATLLFIDLPNNSSAAMSTAGANRETPAPPKGSSIWQDSTPVVACLSTAATGTVQPPTAGALDLDSTAGDSAISGKVVVLDPGHGGFDCGAIGVSGSHEDNLNLDVAKCLQDELIRIGAHVIMTREDENAIAPTKHEDMEKRRQIIADSHSDIVVSIHMNTCSDPNVAGHVVFFMQNSMQGKKLAKAINHSIDQSLDAKKQNSFQANDYFILKSGAQPCVLVECGFISNPEEETKLNDEDYQKQLGKAIFNGIVDYFKDAE